MKRLAALIFWFALVYSAHGQSVQQSGVVTPTHQTCWTTGGVVQDCGTAAQPFATTGGVSPGPWCVNSGPVNGPYQAFCLNVNTTTGGILSIQNFGGAAAGGISFNINGTPASLPTVVTPTVNGDGACFNNTTGTLIDCGFVPTTNILPSGDIFVGNGSNVATAAALSGDCGLSNTGSITCTKTNGVAFGTLATSSVASLSQGGLGGSQAAATANQIPVYPGAGAAAIPTSAPTWFNSAYCNTIGYLIVQVAGTWTCNNSIPANVDWFANVHGDGVSDDTAGINAVLAAVNGIVNFSSKVYCVKTSTGLTTTMANQILQGTAGTLISACGTDTNLLTINADSVQVRNLSFLGSGLAVSSNHHDIVLGTVCTRCRIDHVITAGGYYNVLINAAYTFIYDLRTNNAHGPAAIKMLTSSGSIPGLYMDASQIDQLWPVSAPSGLSSLSAWASTHAYSSGNVVSNSGFYIQESAASCTSGGSAPTNLDYGNSISDGTCTWKLVAPTTFDGLSVDTGSVNTIVTRSDFTGPYTNGIHIHNTLAGSAPIEIDLHVGNTFAQNITSCINAEAGSVLTITAQQCQSGVMNNTIGVWLKSTFTGNYQIESSAITGLGNSSAGVLDQAGASNGGTISNNLIYTGGGTGISIGANINNRTIIGNHAGASNIGSNASCIFVSSGTGDYLNIANNDCNGASSSTVTITGVTGSHNIVWDNLRVLTAFTVAGNVGFGTESNPQAPLIVSANTTTGLSRVNINQLIDIIGANGGNTGLEIDSFAGVTSITGYRANGTATSKTQVLATNPLLSFFAGGYDSTNAYSGTQAGFRITAGANSWTGTDHGSKIDIFTTPNASTTQTQAFEFWGSGGFSIGSANIGTDGGNGILVATGATLTTLSNTATTSAVCYNTGTGVLTYDGTIGTCNTSTRRVKHDIHPLQISALDAVMKMQPVSFYYNADQHTPGQQLGFVAEDLQKIDPRLVALDKDGQPFAIRFLGPMFSYVVGAIHQLKADNDNLRRELTVLKRKIK